MVQNRNKLIELFIGNLSNSIVHQILEKAVGKEFMADRYRKELINSFELAKRYREKINPVNQSLHEKDVEYIRIRIIKRVRVELNLRISKGYENIDLFLVEIFVDRALKKMCVF